MTKIFLSLIFLIPSVSYAKAIPLTDANIIKAILGEAIGESLQGKEAIARAILNRKSLKQVNGLHNPIIKKAKAKDYKDAKEALRLARTRDITKNSIGWGNKSDLQVFNRQAWFKNCYISLKIGNHFFYKLR